MNITSKPATAEPPGTLKRAFALMRLLATQGSRGSSLTDLSKATRLPHPTVHRLLQQLMLERCVRQIEETRRYALGSLAFELGVAAAPQFDMRGICRPTLDRLAESADDTVFLSMRSSDEAVCLDLREGPSPIRVVTLHIGSRRPLGVGAGGLAILGALEESEREGIVRRVLPVLERDWGLGAKELRQSLRLYAERGYALIRNRVHPGIGAIGYPVHDSLGQPIAALSVASINERLSDARLGKILGKLQAAANEVESSLKARYR